MKIAFYQSSTSDKSEERSNFISNLKSNQDIIFFDNHLELEKNIPDVLFIHSSNFGDIEFMGKIKDEFNNTINVIWGGENNSISTYSETQKTIEYLHYTDIDLNLISEFFIKKRTIIEIYNFLFENDDKLEELLKPFAKLSPFAKAKDSIPNEENELTVGKAHEKLMEYVNEKK